MRERRICRMIRGNTHKLGQYLSSILICPHFPPIVSGEKRTRFNTLYNYPGETLLSDKFEIIVGVPRCRKAGVSEQESRCGNILENCSLGSFTITGAYRRTEPEKVLVWSWEIFRRFFLLCLDPLLLMALRWLLFPDHFHDNAEKCSGSSPH